MQRLLISIYKGKYYDKFVEHELVAKGLVLNAVTSVDVLEVHETSIALNYLRYTRECARVSVREEKCSTTCNVVPCIAPARLAT